MALSKKGVSLVASGAFSVFLFVLVVSLSEKFRAERNLTLLAGVLSSLIFLFTETAYGNAAELLWGGDVGWGSVVFSLLISSFAAQSVHLLATLVNVFVSLGWAYLLSELSREQYFKKRD